MRSLSTLLITFFCLFIFFSTACQRQKSEQEKMYTIVMDIHDNVMPEMSTINRLRKQLKAIDTSLVKTPTYPTILTHLNALEQADEGMMSWMAEFSNPTADTEEATALAYLKVEKEKITKVRDQMMESIAAAKKILQEAEKAALIDGSSKK